MENSAEVSKNRVDLYVEYGKSSKHSKQGKKKPLAGQEIQYIFTYIKKRKKWEKANKTASIKSTTINNYIYTICIHTFMYVYIHLYTYILYVYVHLCFYKYTFVYVHIDTFISNLIAVDFDKGIRIGKSTGKEILTVSCFLYFAYVIFIKTIKME